MHVTLVTSHFPGLNLNETINTIGDLDAPVNATGYTLAALNPLFFIGKDEQGSDILCVVKTDAKTLSLTTTSGTYVAESAPKETTLGCVLIGGRPIHRPHEG